MDAVVIGPAAGVTEDTRLNVLACCRTGAAMVVDADALTAFRDDPAELFSVLDRDDVLTPPPGEFERVFPGLMKASPERVAAARAAYPGFLEQDLPGLHYLIPFCHRKPMDSVAARRAVSAAIDRAEEEARP